MISACPFFVKMSLTQQAITDFQKLTGTIGGFGVEITLIAPNGQQATLTGFHTRHHLGIDAEGQRINSTQASIVFSDRNLLNVNGQYPLRNGSGEVDLKGHLVNVKDSTNVVRPYVVKEHFPDEKLSGIVVILSDYSAT